MPSEMFWYHYVILFAASVLAGAINAVAGGGTLLTFPSLIWAGMIAKFANATSTVALWPGQLGSLWGYKDEIGRSHKAIVLLAIPSFAGGAIGAWLLLKTKNATFEALVPYLILTATLLFMIQEPIARWLRRRALEKNPEHAAVTHANPPAESLAEERWPAHRWVIVLVFQFFVAVYGGYFGAGIGILMLAALGFLGFTNIHRMNGLKNINGMCINAVAAAMFIAKGLVNWPLAILMAVGSIVGGYTGAGTARRIGQKNVRRIIILIGLGLTISLLLRG